MLSDRISGEPVGASFGRDGQGTGTLNPMALALQINGAPRTLDSLSDTSTLEQVVAQLGLNSGRVAVEHNGDIIPRSRWPEHPVVAGDKLEVVHFVGGGID